MVAAATIVPEAPKTVVLQLGLEADDIDSYPLRTRPLVETGQLEDMSGEARHDALGTGLAPPTLAVGAAEVGMLVDHRPSAAATGLSEGGAPSVAKPPLGTGPLYKCSVCERLVYESQLDHHVLVCPDPAEAEAAAQTAVADDMNNAVGAAPLPKNGVGAGAGAGLPRRGPGAMKESKENDVALQQTSQVPTSRAAQRRNIMLEEIKKKEEEECTFAPKTLPRGSPRVSASAPGESRWSQRCEQRNRLQKLKVVEAQAYADVTLRPKISRFAQVWSQRQSEACTEGQQPPSVFERLYSSAIQSRIAQQVREAAAEVGSGTASSNSSMLEADSSVSTVAPSTGRRRVFASDLLYSDALFRRERLRTLAEQLHARNEEEARMNCQVSGRSRRYYWQMLERQVKASFDAATGAEPTLRYSALEDFLVSFGCARPPRDPLQRGSVRGDVGDGDGTQAKGSVSSELQSCADEEARKLRAALWRHLDPHKTGHVDLLTLTVFFHVMMGAVDDEAKASLGLTPGSTSTQQVGIASASLAAGGVVGGGDAEAAPQADDGAAGLTAISEEDFPMTVAEEAAGDLEQPSGTGGAAQAGVPQPGDEEGRRIVELLVRFDPTKLRAEFRTMYAHRLHYQNQQATAQHAAEKCDFDAEASVPEMDPHSRDLAERVAERERGEIQFETGEAAVSHADVLLWRHKQTQAKVEEKRAQAKKDEVMDCTFQPKTRTTRTFEGQVETTPRGMSRNQVLYARAVADRERKDMRAQEDAKARTQAEVATCTFKPDTAKSGRSYNRTSDGATPVPRGFYESRHRLRAAGEVERQLRIQREDRLARLAPPVVGVSLSEKVTDVEAREPMRQPGPKTGQEAVAPLAPVAEAEPRRAPLSARGPGPQRGGTAGGANRGLGGSGAAERRATSPRGTGSATPQRGQRAAAPNSRGVGSPLRARRTSPSPPRAVGSLPPHAGSPQPRAASPQSPRWQQRTTSAEPLGSSGNTSAMPAEGMTDGHASRTPLAPAPSPRLAGGTAASNVANGALTPPPSGGAVGPQDCGDTGAAPILFVDVNIAAGCPPERIVLREGQSVREVVTEFAAKHSLTPVMAQRLHTVLREALHQQEPQAQRGH